MPLIAGFGMLIHTKSRRTLMGVVLQMLVKSNICLIRSVFVVSIKKVG